MKVVSIVCFVFSSFCTLCFAQNLNHNLSDNHKSTLSPQLFGCIEELAFFKLSQGEDLNLVSNYIDQAYFMAKEKNEDYKNQLKLKLFNQCRESTQLMAEKQVRFMPKKLSSAFMLDQVKKSSIFEFSKSWVAYLLNAKAKCGLIEGKYAIHLINKLFF